MDMKEEVRRRIAELTRFAYERGYRDGAQSALTEMETIGNEDIAKQLGKEVSSSSARAGRKMSAKKPVTAKAAKSAKTKPAKVIKKKPAAKPKADVKDRARPKTQIIQEAIRGMLDTKGEARRDEVLAAAQAENPSITKFDLGNGLRILVKQSKVRVSPEDSALLLPAA